MKVKSALVETCCTSLQHLLEVVDPLKAAPEHVADAFHANFGWDPQSLTEEEAFDPSTVEAVELDIARATRTIGILGKYFSGDLS